MAKLSERLRWLLRPRLDVFAPKGRPAGQLVGMVAMRLTTSASRTVRVGMALSGAAVAGIGPILAPHAAAAALTMGAILVISAIRTLATTTVIADAPLARAAVRAALTEGKEIGKQNWRIEGPAAIELGTELERLQSIWLPGAPGQSGELDRARATMITQQASPRLARYLGELSLAEHQAWLATPGEVELTGEEPDHPAEYRREGADWPSLNAPESGPIWPTLQDRDQP